MALQYGVNINASDVKRILEENDKQRSGIRTWRQLFGNASLGAEAQKDALGADFSSAMAEAYKTNLAQRASIMGAGLSSGSARDLLSANRNDLLSAYNTYVKNYGTAANSIATSYGQEVDTINKGLDERAQNFAALYDSAYKYLSEELYGAYQTIDDTKIDYFKDQGLDWLLTDNGDLMSWDLASERLFNSDGAINYEGRNFFDQIFNAIPQNWVRDVETKDDIETQSVRSFDKWLSDTNADLRDWWATQDDYNYTFAGTNKGTAQHIIGLESTDDVYTPAEKYNFKDVTSGRQSFKSALDKPFETLQNTITSLETEGIDWTYDYDPSQTRSDAANYARVRNETISKNQKVADESTAQLKTATEQYVDGLLTSMKNTLDEESYAEFLGDIDADLKKLRKLYRRNWQLYNKDGSRNMVAIEHYKNLSDNVNNYFKAIDEIARQYASTSNKSTTAKHPNF